MAAAQELMGRREQEDQQRREHILTTAERLFAHQGFNNTSVSQIAKESEFGVGTLYKYFKDKNAILHELFRFRLVQETIALETILWPATPRHAIRILDDLLMARIDQISQMRTFFMVYFTYIQPQLVSPDFQGIEGFSQLHELHMKGHTRVEELLAQASEAGHITAVPTAYLVAAMHGIVVSYFYTCVVRYGLNGDWPVDEMKDSLRKILYDKVLLNFPEE